MVITPWQNDVLPWIVFSYPGLIKYTAFLPRQKFQ